ncbi:glycosyltransferase family 2 protein [Tropicimonas sp. IMCC6043]|uniref:glycosyltransferase family 2 protein n=1 Tax=Tropicimonas sp. IMCC6043 TaxID=2510645 RepID=UPI0013ECFB2A|nr:glycosyltransferase family 2 protein [Tropicimonas sp. IMCC6043]
MSALAPRRIRTRLEHHAKTLRSQLATLHVSGPKKFQLADDEVCGVLLGRNISYYIPEFMAHYRAIGMKYLVYMDYGSDDGSIGMMAKYDDVIILSNTLNFRDYQRYMRMHAATRYAEGGWRLAVDADEILRYPGDDRIDLPGLVRRLAGRGQTGVVAQMLEMVPDCPLEEVDTLSFAEARRVFRNYSLENISAYPYHSEETPLHWFLSQNSVADPHLAFMFGGLRRTLFSEDCCLSKHVLYRPGRGVVPMMHPHVTMGLHCADFTALLQHYKFAGGYLERERRRQVEKRLSHSEGDLRLAALARNPKMRLTFPGIRHDPTLQDLIRDGFLWVSSPARQMLGV